MLRRILRSLCPALLPLFLWGCAAASPPQEGALPQWPPAPLPAKILWSAEIRDYDRFGRTRGWLERISDFLTGGEPAAFARPYGVFSDGSGRLFVADTGASKLIVLEPGKSRPLVLAGSGGEKLRTPIAVTGDGSGNYYVTDSTLGAVYRIDLAGRKLIRLSHRRLGRPTGIAFNRANGLLYVSDTATHQIAALDPGGTERFRIGARGSAPGEFNFPTDLFADAKGQLYVTDALNHRVQILTPEGQPVSEFGKEGDVAGYFSKPKGVAVDSEGHIYVVDALLGSVQIFDDAGGLLLAFGTNGTAEGEFWMPSGISIDEKDDIYVVDTHNRRVQVFRYLGEHGAEREGSVP